MSEQADAEITSKWYEYLDAIQNGDDERVRLEKVYKEAVEQKIQLQRIPSVPRFEDARPFEHIFCDLKTYKQKVYGQRAGEMMFTDFKSQLWDVEAVTANKHSDIARATSQFILKHGLKFINDNHYPITFYGDGDGGNKHVKWTCAKYGIRYTPIPPRAQELNLAEQTVAHHGWNAARAVLAGANLKDEFLMPFAIRFVCKRHYLLASDASRGWKSPCEIITGEPPVIDLNRLPPFYTVCFVPSGNERKAELARQRKKKGLPYDYARAEQGRYLGEVDILSTTPQARLDITNKVVGARHMRFKYGDHKHDAPQQPGNSRENEHPTKIQIIDNSTYDEYRLPIPVRRIMPEYTEMEVQDNGTSGHIVNANLEANELCNHYDDEYDITTPYGDAEGDPTCEEGDPTEVSQQPWKPTGELAAAIKEMESNDAHVPIYSGEEWPRPLSEIARPADNNAEQFSLDTDTGKPREGAIPLERTRSAQKQVLQTVKEPTEHQIRKIYTLATEKVEEVNDQEYKSYLRENLEDWYTRRIDHLIEEDPDKAELYEIKRAYLIAREKNADMDWKQVKTDPKLLEDAIIARDKEINSLLKNILVHLTPESHDYEIAVKSATNCRMILAIKRDGTVKCRLVKQGFRENCSVTDGPDFHYASSVVSLSTVRLILSKRNLTGTTRVSLRDISTAFLQSTPYPEGQWKYCKYRCNITGEWKYYRQISSIYGEKSAPMRWQNTLFPWLEAHGFEPGKNEKSIFYLPERDLTILVYVDDCLAVGEEEDIKWFWKLLGERFECKDEEWLTPDTPLDYLGMEVTLDSEYLWIGMKDYIEKMVHNLNIQVLTENKCKTPIHKAINEDGTSTPLTALERHDFLCALGMTGWLNQTARPDIALAQSRIAQHCANPTQDAMEAVLHLVSYLYHTRDLCIRTNLKGETEQELLLQEYTKDSADHGWSFHSDTDHAGNKEVQNHRRSQNSRYCCHNGMVVDWRSTIKSYATCTRELKEAHPDVSSGAAEIYGASTATQDILALKYITEEANMFFPLPIELQIDNDTCKAFGDDTVVKSRMKHIDVRQEWVQILRDHDIFTLIHVPTIYNVADLGTKILLYPTFSKLRDMIMFWRPTSPTTQAT